MDFDSKIKCFELIKEFTHKYGYYDAYSLTAYHDIEYYLDCFAKIMTTNKNNKNQYPISSLIYPKCFNMSDVLIYEENHRKKNNKFLKNELNTFTGRNINYKDACKRFIGLLIWDVYNSGKYSVTDAIEIVEKWLEQKYGMVVLSEDDNVDDNKLREQKYKRLGIKMEVSSMVKLYETAKVCIENGEYLMRNNRTGKYFKPELSKSDDFNETLQNEFWNKTMHLKHGNNIFSRSV